MKKKALLVEIDAQLKDAFSRCVGPGRTMTGEIEAFIRDYVAAADATGRVAFRSPIERNRISFTLVPGPRERDEAAVALFRVAGDSRSFVVRFSVTGTLEALLRIQGFQRGGGPLGALLLPFYEFYLQEHLDGLGEAAREAAEPFVRRMFDSNDLDLVATFLSNEVREQESADADRTVV
jgi:hypothetical protein